MDLPDSDRGDFSCWRAVHSSSYHHQIGSMTHFRLLILGYGHETVVCAICPSMFLCSFLLSFAGTIPRQRWLIHYLSWNWVNSSVSQIPRYLAVSGSQRPNPEHAFHRGPACDTGTLGLVWLTARLSVCRDLNWSALVNHIGIHPLPANQPTLIGHALYIKPRPSQFSVPHVPPCMHGNSEIFGVQYLID